MSEITVKKLSEIVGAPVETLLQQMQDAGIHVTGADDIITDRHKLDLLQHIRQSSGAADTSAKSGKNTLKKRSSNELKLVGAAGNGSRTVNVEVRRKKTILRKNTTAAPALTEADASSAEPVTSNRAEELSKELDAERQALEKVLIEQHEKDKKAGVFIEAPTSAKPRKVKLKKRSSEELKLAGAASKDSRTVNVEVRRKKTILRKNTTAALTEGAAEAEEAPVETAKPVVDQKPVVKEETAKPAASETDAIATKARRNHLSPPLFPHAWASDWGQDQYGLWQAFTYKNIRYVFRWISPGDFMMGDEFEDNSKPSKKQSHVTLTQGFWLGETTVTQSLWQVVMDDDPSHFKGEQLPVEQVSWNDCQAFIDALKALHPDLKVGFPTEAQWEYACRAGSETPFYFGGKDDLTLDRVNYSGQWNKFSSDGASKVVKSLPCNDWGLYEMHGNVWEWCEDAWQGSFDKASVIDPVNKAKGDKAGAERVIRGGSWSNQGRSCRSAIRNRAEPGYRYDNIGFRLSLGH